jgi:CBS domain-containing protein
MPSNPHHEFVIAIAGPLVNVGIAVLLVALLLAVPATGSFGELSADAGPLLPRLMITNIFLAAFNLIPAFPMDGGRVLRALLSRRMGRSRATTTAARVWQALAVAFGVLGLVAYPMLLIIALFVWLGGAAEARAEELHEAIDGLPVGRAMETRFDVLRPDTPLDDARGLVMAGSQIDFPVLLADGRIVGLVGREAIAEGLAAFGPAAPVTAVMTRQGPTVSVTEDLQSALERLSGQAWRTVPVVDQRGMLVGLLSVENLSELLMFRKAYLVDPVPSRAT